MSHAPDALASGSSCDPLKVPIIFIRQPDGSLAQAGPSERLEREPREPAKWVGPSRLARTARALRQAVEEQIALETLESATARQARLWNFLTATLLLDVVLGGLSEVSGARAQMILKSPGLRALACFLPSIWWCFAIVYYTLGFTAVRSVRANLYGWLGNVAYASCLAELLLSVTVVHWIYPLGHQGAMIGPLMAIMAIPLRLTVGFQSKSMQADLKKLMILPPPDALPV